MRRPAQLILFLLLLFSAACSESRQISRVAGSGDLTPENASLVATVASNAPDEEVRNLLSALGEGGYGIEAAGYQEPPVFLLLFRSDATLDQRQAAFTKLAETGFFTSIVCSSCSRHTSRPTVSPAGQGNLTSAPQKTAAPNEAAGR